jgi:hypothetical protein
VSFYEEYMICGLVDGVTMFDVEMEWAQRRFVWDYKVDTINTGRIGV